MITEFIAKHETENVSKEFKVFPYSLYYVTLCVSIFIVPALIKVFVLPHFESKFLGIFFIILGIVLFLFTNYYEKQTRKEMTPYLKDLNEQIKRNYNEIRNEDIERIVFKESIPVVFSLSSLALVTIGIGIGIL